MSYGVLACVDDASADVSARPPDTRSNFREASITLVRLLLVLVAIASAAAPVLADDAQDCFQGQDPELRIRGCTQIIKRAPNDTTGYHNRAAAYILAGDIDKAIADYTKVIETAPDNASAYANRSRAYASSGNYAQRLRIIRRRWS